MALLYNFAPWRISRSYQDPNGRLKLLLGDHLVLSPDGQWILAKMCGSQSKETDAPRFHRSVLIDVQSGDVFGVSDTTWRAPAAGTPTYAYADFTNDSKWLQIMVRCMGSFQILLWNMDERKLVELPEVETAGLDFKSILSPDSRTLFFQRADGAAKLIDLQNRKIITSLTGVRRYVYSRKGDRLLVNDAQQNILVLDAHTGSEVHRIPAQDGWTVKGAVALTDTRLYVIVEYTRGRSEFQIFDLGTSKPVFYRMARLARVSDLEKYAAIFEQNEQNFTLLHLETFTLLPTVSSFASARELRWCFKDEVVLVPATGGLYKTVSGVQVFDIRQNESAFISQDNERMLCRTGATKGSIRNTRSGEDVQHIENSFLPEGSEFSRDGLHFVTYDSETNAVQYWTRYRPEEWWGAVWLPEFWTVFFLLSAALLSFLKDLKLAKQKPLTLSTYQ